MAKPEAPISTFRGESRQKLSPEQTATVEANSGLVHFVARRYKTAVLNYDERLSAGFEGLVQAAANFDPNKRPSFSTHAVPRIKGAMQDERRSKLMAERGLAQGDVRVLDSTYSAKSKFVTEKGREPTSSELSALTGVPEKKITKAYERFAKKGPISFEVVAKQEGEDFDDTQGPSSKDTTPEERVMKRDLLKSLRESLGQLTPQEKEISSLHFIEDLTWKEIILKSGLPKDRVFGIRDTALAKLRVDLSKAA